MSEIIIICIASLLASLITFFSGFGLGTILTPVFAIFFPIEIAIALTGVVHFLNNVFKLILIGKHANKNIVVRFGLPAFFAAMVGAFLLVKISDLPPLLTYSIDEKTFHMTLVKVVVAVLLIFFSLMEVLPSLKKIEFGSDKLVIGGMLSGFFGGLSGNQGALRSAFLIRSGLTKESFIATGVVIACIIDCSRLGIYATRFLQTGLHENMTLIISATLSAFAGAYIGSKLLNKITLSFIQIMVTIMLILLSVTIGLGII